MASSAPKVTTVIPVFNGAAYLGEAIESVLAQGYGEVEIIVVNDGSTDDGATRRIAGAFSDRILYVEQENQGISGALNTGIARMSGAFFCWLSHDDVFLPHKIEAQVAFLSAIGRDDVILFGDYLLIDAAGRPFAEARGDRDLYARNPRMALLRGSLNGCTMMVPRAAFARCGVFDPGLRYTQDYDLWSRMSEAYAFVHLPQILVGQRSHPDQGSHHAGASVAADALWRGIIEGRGEVERALVAGSARRFHDGLLPFLDQTPYGEAARHARRLATAPLDDVLVSVIVMEGEDGPQREAALRSVLGQTHARLDVILLDASRGMATGDPRVRMSRHPGPGGPERLELALESARGDYIAFLEPGAAFPPDRIETQLLAMQETGVLASHIPEDAGPGDEAGADEPGRPILLSRVMVHRAVVASGFRLPETVVADGAGAFLHDVAVEHPVLAIDRMPPTGHR